MKRALVRRLGLVGAMVATVGAVAALAYWDADRESTAALQDFAQEQATLASALGVAVALHASPAQFRTIERPRSLAILLREPGETMLRASDGRRVASARVMAALERGDALVRIPRDEAPDFGLRPRTALAGFGHVDAGGGRAIDVVAVASAERERDRGAWARRRLVLSVLGVTGLVVTFGGIALRNQRKELVLERELAVANLEQTRDQRLARANRAAAMGTLAIGIAHEISTPLGIIAARAEQIGPKVAYDERLSAGVAAIAAQTERIDQVIRGLLGLARGDVPSTQRLHPHTLVEGAVALVEHRFAKVGVALQRREADGAALPVVSGDPRLLEHAIVNLLLNACDACKHGGAVTITARGDADEVEIVVEDSGSGISPADIGRAREPFFTTKAREGGTGLGLAIAHEIVASHRGTLVLAPAAPRGTRAAIRLPRSEASFHA
jgi:two-component system, NtrC family, sensor kinase